MNVLQLVKNKELKLKKKQAAQKVLARQCTCYKITK